MNIVIPTHRKDFVWNLNFLKTFSKKCLDYKDVIITFVVTDEQESLEFNNMIIKYGLNNLNLSIVNSKLKQITFPHKWTLISLKKMLGVLHANEDSLVFDSEIICINEFYFKSIFDSIRQKDYQYCLLNDPYDTNNYDHALNIAKQSADILNTNNNKWFFQKAYWFFEIKYLLEMLQYIKEVNKIENYIELLQKKIFYDYQIYGNYLFENKIKNFVVSYESMMKSKINLFENWKNFKKTQYGKDLMFQYICKSINENCIEEYIEYLKDEDERIVKIHWMPENCKKRLENETSIAFGVFI